MDERVAQKSDSNTLLMATQTLCIGEGMGVEFWGKSLRKRWHNTVNQRFVNTLLEKKSIIIFRKETFENIPITY